MRVLLLALIAAVTPGQIVAKLNAQRVANGIPGGITLNAPWTTGCEHHVRYEELNGITWTHQETPGKPGFTKDGQLAGAGGDQSYTSGWEFGNPFENLPLHMATLMAPGLMRRTTGPTIYVFSAGPWQFRGAFHLSAARLAGPGGPVAIRVVDDAQHPKIKPYVSPGTFFLIPVSPLRSHARYTATVTVAGANDSRRRPGTSRRPDDELDLHPGHGRDAGVRLLRDDAAVRPRHVRKELQLPEPQKRCMQ